MKTVQRILQPDDLEALVQFQREANGLESCVAYWRWKYFHHPRGASPFAAAFAPDGRMVGLIGGMTMSLQVQDQCLNVTQPVDIDILKPYRGRLYRVLEGLARQRSIEYGNLMDFAFPNQRATAVGIKVSGFIPVAPVRKWVRPIGMASLLSRFFAMRSTPRANTPLPVPPDPVASASAAAILPIERFDERFDRLWARARQAPVMVVRNAACLNWRYRDCPVATYARYALCRQDGEVDGYVVLQTILRNGRLHGLLVDLLTARDAPGAMRTLLRHGIRHCKREQTDALIAWAARGSPLAAALRAGGFLQRPVPSNLIVRPYPEAPAVPLDLLRHESHWHYTLGDSDYHLVPRKREQTT